MPNDPETVAAVRRVQAWMSDERQAGRLVFQVPDEWIAKLLEVANGTIIRLHVSEDSFILQCQKQKRHD